MHPALSVILFTTLSGAGYGLWFWLAMSLLVQPGPQLHGPDGLDRHVALLTGFALGFVMVAAGLLSSTLHLGKPLRAWRAFSQWRSSWLSREGVLAMATFLPFLALAGVASGWLAIAEEHAWIPRLLLATLMLLSLATVACTAMIYASLKPIPAWSHRAVLPVYLGFALLTGGLAALAWMASAQWPGNLPVLALLLLAVGLGVGKRRYWRDIDRGSFPASRASALGLPADRQATVFERPHTEANYLTTEMGYVLARKHSRRLRRIGLALFAAIPVAACVATLVWPPLALPALGSAAVAALLGAMVERWLFFAEARHVVTLYY